MEPDLEAVVIPASVAAYIQTGDFVRALNMWNTHADKLNPHLHTGTTDIVMFLMYVSD